MPWITFGALMCAVSVACGAFGAHALADKLDARALEIWETGSRYLMFSGLGVTLIGLTAQALSKPGLGMAAGAVTIGGIVFFSTLAAIALGGPKVLGMITPLGGLLMIIGFVLFAFQTMR